MKICSKCKVEKDESAFYITYNKYKLKKELSTYCNDCWCYLSRQYRLKNKDKISERRKLEKHKIVDVETPQQIILDENILVGTKICTHCKIEKDKSEFRIKTRKMVGYRKKVLSIYCKECCRKDRKEYRDNNKELLKEYRKSEANKIAQAKYYRKKHPNSKPNPTTAKIKEYCKQYNVSAEETPYYRLRRNMSDAIRRTIVGCKQSSFFNYLDYNKEELFAYLESLFEPWMNWNNYGSYHDHKYDPNDKSTWRWQLDHIQPQSDLPYDNMEHENFKKCWDLSNLRPLEARQNLLDGATRVRHKKNII